MIGENESGKGARDGGGPMDGGVKDDLENSTTGATSMTGGDSNDDGTGQPAFFNDARPGGQAGGASEEDLGSIGMESARPGPMGESGGGQSLGQGANGSLGSGTYNDRGNVTGADSPAGNYVDLDAGGQGQGDDLADRLGGGDGSGTGMTGAGASSGDMDAGRSERTGTSAQGAAGAGGPDAGSPGGMGGPHARSGATGAGRPPGGVSPIQLDRDRSDS